MKSKKLLAAALAAVLTLAGCGTTVLSAEETKELLTLSQKTMATVESSGNDDGNGYVHGRGNRGNHHSR